MGWLLKLLVFILVNSLAVSTIQRVQAQCPAAGTVPVGFTVDKPITCVGSPIKITESATVKSTAYNYNYNGTTPVGSLTLVPLVSSYTYTQPGSYTILQAGSGNGTAVGFTYCQTVKVVPVDPIKFSVKACSGRKVLVDVALDASTGQYDSYTIKWGDGQVTGPLSRAQIVMQQSHTYVSGGSNNQTVAIAGAYASAGTCSPPESKSVVTLGAAPTVPTIVKLTTVSDNSISLQYSASTGTAVQLYQKVGGTYTATGQNGVSAGTFSIMTDAKQVQCFQVVTQDACNSAGLASDEVCSLVLDAQAASKQNNLNWQPYAGTATQFRFYRVLRNGAPTGGTLTSRVATTYTDANKIECGVPYCYSIEATVGPTTITSAPSCVTGINGDVPGSFTNVIVSVENNHPRLVAPLPTTSSSYSMIVSRASGPAGPFTPVATVANKNTFVDEVDASAGSYCYQLTYQNNCGLTSTPSKPVCSVYLSSKSPTSVDWTTDSPFAPGAVVRYSIEVIDSLKGTKEEFQLGGNSHYEPTDPNFQAQQYRVIAYSASGAVSYSNFYTFRRELKILVPDAFTPNGDGINDVFLTMGVFVDTFKINVYDRWGEVVFSTTDKTKGWDGTIGGQPAIKGQYMYRIDIEDLTGQKTVRTGAVLLLR